MWNNTFVGKTARPGPERAAAIPRIVHVPPQVGNKQILSMGGGFTGESEIEMRI